MTEEKQIFKCNICGNIVEVLHNGVGELVCCSQKMELLKENTIDAAIEKHVPVVEKIGDNVFKISVGSIEHPMTDDHYIEWIEIIANNKVYRYNLRPGDEPIAIFKIVCTELIARAYCNKHRLWKIKADNNNW